MTRAEIRVFYEKTLENKPLRAATLYLNSITLPTFTFGMVKEISETLLVRGLLYMDDFSSFAVTILPAVVRP